MTRPVLRSLGFLALLAHAPPLFAQSPAGSSSTSTLPMPVLLRAPAVQLPAPVDSNSPVVWTHVEGEPRMRVVTSVDGQPSVAEGRRINTLANAAPVQFLSHPGHGVWMEAVVEDDQGTWYGYYHNEIPAELCGRLDRVVPRIGAARSIDHGVTWEDLGIVLEAPLDSHDCASRNGYFLGGVGDFSVLLDPDHGHAYFFFSQYGREASGQGIAMARLLWAVRDSPVGRMEVWNEGAWLPATALVTEVTDEILGWTHAPGTSLFSTTRPWHDDDPANDAFWGASVHWNTFLGRYVMLLNRATNEEWTQEGIYIAYGTRLDDPTTWTPPQPLIKGGGWYPQVIGIEADGGTDKQAGRHARLFVGGVSGFMLEFRKP